jgi:hypothetical protein
MLSAPVDDHARNPQAARQGGEFAGRKFGDNRPICGIYLLDRLAVGPRIDPELIRLARVVQVFIEELNLGLQVRLGRRRRRAAAGRQNIAAVLNCNCRRLTSVHEARCGNLYRLSVTSHGSTYLLTQYLVRSFRIPFEDHGPTAIGRAVGFFYTLLAIGCYCRSLRINWGCWLAWARTEIPACSNT